MAHKSGATHRRNKKMRIAGLQNWRCCYCGTRTWFNNQKISYEERQYYKNEFAIAMGFSSIYLMSDEEQHKFDMLEATIDHVKPKCRGGRLDDENAVLACRGCNEQKQDMNVKNFLKEREGKVVEPCCS